MLVRYRLPPRITGTPIAGLSGIGRRASVETPRCYSDFVFRIPWYVAWPLVLAVTVIALLFMARRSIYYPVRYPNGFWNLKAQLHALDVWLESADHVRLHGWYVAQPQSRWVTLFLHGNAGNLTHRYMHFREITGAASSVLMVDYRGYGKSAGTPSEKGLYLDAEAAYLHLLSTGHNPEHIILHGESLGSAVAVDLASRRRCGALILEAPFTAASDVAGTVLPIVGPLLVRGFDSRRKIGGVHAPILFIHGAADEIVPLRFGQALFAVAPEPKAFWTVPGSGHNDIIETAGAGYGQRLRSFYGSLTRY